MKSSQKYIFRCQTILAICATIGVSYKSASARDPERVVRIAVVQAGEEHSKENPGPQGNFDVLAKHAREAAAAEPRPDLICFPEYSLSGWPYPEEKEINALAEKVPGDGPWYR